MAENKSFTSKDKGQNEGALIGGVLDPNGGSLIVDDKRINNLASGSIIPGIRDIFLDGDDGPTYTCTINVVGACPSGATDNKLIFKDDTGDEYVLRIYSETEKKHTVHYNSFKPAIVKITWDI